MRSEASQRAKKEEDHRQKNGSRFFASHMVSFTTIVQDTKMGEEKPEEELMGKRKSSPRFDNIFHDAVFYYGFRISCFYTSKG
jgi:hypothetical protein